MLRRLAHIFEHGGDFVARQTAIAAADLRTAAVRSAVLACGILLAGAGGLAVIAGLTMLLAQTWGLPAALLGVGAAVLLLAGGGLAASLAARAREATRRTRQRLEGAERARAALAVEAEPKPAVPARRPPIPAFAPTGTRANTSRNEQDDPDMLDSIKKAAADNPALAASAAFAVLSLLGPGRTIKLISRGATALSLAASIKDAASPDSASDPASNGAAARPPSG